jgi:hypothetical protein
LLDLPRLLLDLLGLYLDETRDERDEAPVETLSKLSSEDPLFD